MRRHTLILALVAMLSVTGIASAQTAFPPELNGNGAVQGDTELKFVPTEHFQLPWSMPGPDDSTAWLTDIYVQILPPYDLLVEQECLLVNNECWLPPAYPPTLYPWRADIGSYCNTTQYSNGDMAIDCYVYGTQEWRHYVGHLDFTGHPPQFYDWGWYILDVAATGSAAKHRHEQEQAPLALD